MRKQLLGAASVLILAMLMYISAKHYGTFADENKTDMANILSQTEDFSDTDGCFDQATYTEQNLDFGAEHIFNQDVSAGQWDILPQDVILGQGNIFNQDESGAQDDMQDEEDNEYADLAIMNVKNYVNVRNKPDTSGDIVGKIYPHAVAQVLGRAGENDEWFEIISGNVEGYIKAEFFLYGDEARDEIEKNVVRYATVLADRLNVREEPTTDAKRIGYLNHNEKAKLLEDLGEWLKVSYGEGKEGYVAKEYTLVAEEFIYAKSIEEERAEEEAKKAQTKRKEEKEEKSKEILGDIVFPSNNYGSNEELRKAIVDYATQYLGNKYVHGGSSLINGTDCSGFTSLIYKDFGYSISRTPGGQYSSDGRSISFEEIKPGDIICYGKSKCTHVALYIGDGQIIHEANSKKGVVIYKADYDNILAIKNVID